MNTPRPAERAPHVLRLTRTFDAPRERVFAAFTEPDLIARWWGPDGFRTPRESVVVDLAPGGRHHKDMVLESPQIAEAMGMPVGSVFPDRATIVEVDPPALLVLASEPQPEIGITERTISRIEFHDEGARTRVELLDGPYGDAMAPNAERGWSEQLDRLVASFQEGRTG